MVSLTQYVCMQFVYIDQPILLPPPPPGYQCIAAYVGITAAGLYVYYLTHKEIERDRIEMRSGKHAILPLLVAERDREYLKQLRRNRDEEATLMANVPGWKVGTWYGEPIYKTKSADQFFDPTFKEFYVHTDTSAADKRANIKLWS